jgi:hypothetical protein
MVELKIMLVEESGQVSVNGPISNRILCYGMLEMAKDAITQFHEKQANSKILQVPPGAALPPLKLD